MALLIDTSVLAAYAFKRDKNHDRAVKFIEYLTDKSSCVVAAPVLSELFYFVTVRMSYAHAVRVFAATRIAFPIEALNDEDMHRMYRIMTRYGDNAFDYTDVAIMALAERLSISRIATFDQRDFGVYRPTHCEYFDLLPH